jgi:hypothetical protein
MHTLTHTHTHTHTQPQPQRIRGIKFWDVVPLDHLLARLEGETPGNAALIVELLQSSYFPTDKSEATRVTRCLQMAQSQPRAARVFFRHLAQFVPGAVLLSCCFTSTSIPCMHSLLLLHSLHFLVFIPKESIAGNIYSRTLTASVTTFTIEH